CAANWPAGCSAPSVSSRKARWIFPVPWPIPIGANAEAPARASNTAWVQHATHRSHPNAKQAGRHKHGNHRSYAWLIAPLLRVAGHRAARLGFPRRRVGTIRALFVGGAPSRRTQAPACHLTAPQTSIGITQRFGPFRPALPGSAAMHFVPGVLLHQLAGDAVGPAETVLQGILAAAGMLGTGPQHVFFHQLAFPLEQLTDDGQPAPLD